MLAGAAYVTLGMMPAQGRRDQEPYSPFRLSSTLPLKLIVKCNFKVKVIAQNASPDRKWW